MFRFDVYNSLPISSDHKVKGGQFQIHFIHFTQTPILCSRFIDVGVFPGLALVTICEIYVTVDCSVLA